MKQGVFRLFKRGDFLLLYDISFSWMIILVPSSSFDRPQSRVRNFHRKKKRGKVCFLCGLLKIYLFNFLIWKSTTEVSFVN